MTIDKVGLDNAEVDTKQVEKAYDEGLGDEDAIRG
jgi:hypothetical protein